MVRERVLSEELARGIIMVLFGVLALTVPAGFLTLLLRMFGFVALIDGVLAFVGLLRKGRFGERSQWTLALEGVGGVGAGLLTLWWPAITAFVLLTVLGIWAFLTGAAELFKALEEASTGHKALGVLRAVLGLAFGLLLLAHPLATGATMVLLVGCYAIAMGVMQIGTVLVRRQLTR